MEYNIGDKVMARRRWDQIVNNNEDFDDYVHVIIVGKSKDHYLAQLPSKYKIKTSWIAGDDDIAIYGADKKYVGQLVIFLNESKIDGFQNVYDGMNCSLCGEFNKYAEPNQDDGTMICWSCRQNPYRSSYK